MEEELPTCKGLLRNKKATTTSERRQSAEETEVLKGQKERHQEKLEEYNARIKEAGAVWGIRV